MNREQVRAKRKIHPAAAPGAQFSGCIMSRNKMSCVPPHESSSAGSNRESFVQVSANI
jgi:hypothetical protein